MLNESKQSIVNLGFPTIIATLFFEKFGSKAFLIAKWYKEYNTFRGEDPHWWENISHGLSKMNVVHAVKLYNAASEFAAGQIDLSTYNQKRSKLGFADDDGARDIEETLRGLKDFVADEFFEESFFRRNIISDFLKGKLKKLDPYSKLSFRDASDRYEEKLLFSSKKPVREYDNGWKWIDAGPRCDIVGRLMSNCGSAGLMSDDPAKTILTLFDPKLVPHVITTYSPTKKELGAIQGGAGSKPKNEYVDYIIDLADFLKVRIDRGKSESKYLNLKYLLRSASIQQIPGSGYEEFFIITFPDGSSYYSDSYSAVPQQEADNLTLSKPVETLTDRLKLVFNHYEKDKILKANPTFTYRPISSFVENGNLSELKQFIKECIRSYGSTHTKIP